LIQDLLKNAFQTLNILLHSIFDILWLRNTLYKTVMRLGNILFPFLIGNIS